MILTLELALRDDETHPFDCSKVFENSGGTIGGGPGNEWVLPELSAAAEARILFEGGVFQIVDMGADGVFVNSRENRLVRGTPYTLKSGDRIFIGRYTIEVSIAEHADAKPSVPRESGEKSKLEETAFGMAPAPPRAPPMPTARPSPPSTGSFGGSKRKSGPAKLSEEDSWEPGTRAMAPAPQPTMSAPSSGGLGSWLPRRSHEEKPTKDRGRYTVWFATNRQPTKREGSAVEFSSTRDSSVHYGRCLVVIPESHRIGSIGSPWWKRLLTLRDDRLRLAKTVTLGEPAYWQQLGAALRKRAIGERDAVVFLHGYNVSFEEAAIRSAQLGFDLGVKGAMAFYSWPSRGTLTGYPADEASIEASEGHIADYLTAMAKLPDIERVHVIAHSMGNRGLLRAIDRIAVTAAEKSKKVFHQIILAAADVDQDTFRRLSSAYAKVAERTTMYVCSKDLAVEASHWVHGYPRAGLTPPLLVVPGIDTINVSNLDLTLLGHGYVAAARELLTDIHTLLQAGTPPGKRFGLRRESTRHGEYWNVGK